MRTSVDQPATLQPAPALPSWKAAVAFLHGFTRRIRQALASMRSGTTLVRDPFSTEQTRD
jgi:hypothetical protein